MVGPGVSNLCRGAKEGLSGNSPVPAHMGAWPEREAPAEEFASANFAVEGGMIRRSPFFLRGVCLGIALEALCTWCDTSRPVKTDMSEGRAVQTSLQELRTATTMVVWAIALICSGAGCLSPPPKAAAGGASTIEVSDVYRDSLWERAVVVLNRNHFQVARESKLEGIIETEYRGGSNLIEPWHPDSVGYANRLESTLQSIRRRIVINMQSAGPGQMTVLVRADKEIEDLPGLAANYEGGATFSESQPLNRDLNQVVGQSSASRWLPLGRDPLLERKLLNEIQGRLVP